MASNERRPRVHYLCFGVEQTAKDRLSYFPSAQAKTQYMIEAMKSEGFLVQVVSSCAIRQIGIFRARTIAVDEREHWRYFSSFRTRLSGLNKASNMLGFLQLLLYCLLVVRRDDRILVYHSIYYLRPLRWVRRLRRLDFVLQLEEIYSLIDPVALKYQAREQSFISEAAGYVLVNDVIGEYAHLGDKPRVVAYGDYRVPRRRHSVSEPQDRVEVVYAGVIEGSRRAAFTAVEAAEWLPPGYRVNILGFGPRCSVDELLVMIAGVNARVGEERVVFHGARTGSEFHTMLQSCHIGLNCHSYNELGSIAADVCFPNKVTVYLANGLRVVSRRLKVLEESGVSGLLHYYDSDDPAALAVAIRAVDLSAPYDSRERILELDSGFRAALLDLIARGSAGVSKHPDEDGTSL